MYFFPNVSKILAYLVISTVLATAGFTAFSNPAHAANITVSPPKFEFEVEKEQTVDGVISITNGDQDNLLLSASVADFTAEGESGQPAFHEGENATSFSMSSWISLPEEVVSVPAGEKVAIPFGITVPEGAEAGGHFGTIFFSPVTPKEGTISVQQKVGVLLLVRVAGDVIEQSEITTFDTYREGIDPDSVVQADPSYFYSSFPVVFGVRLDNTGNVHVKPKGTVVLKNMFGSVLGRVGEEAVLTSTGAITGTKLVDYLPVNDRNGNVLPQSSRVFLSEWKGYGSQALDADGGRVIDWRGIGFGRYTAELNLSYGDAKLPVQSIHFWIIPWMIILLSLAGLAILIILIKFWRTHSRERLKQQLREELEAEQASEHSDVSNL